MNLLIMEKHRFPCLLFALLVMSYCFPQTSSSINYEEIAVKIVKGCKTKVDKAEAIYKYLCDNIAYDTDYKIYTADECFRARKGVCQAYSELFKELCTPLGINCIIVTGIAKHYDHVPGQAVDSKGHAWLLVESDNPGYYFFVDPTWGAGSVSNGVFTKKDNDMSWFRTTPQWMIFTHLPENEEYQLLENPVSEKEFAGLPGLYPKTQYLGFDGSELLKGFRNGTLKVLPRIYDTEKPPLEIVEIPLTDKLHVGETYKFAFKGNPSYKYAVVQNNDFNNDFTVNGNNYSIEYIPYEEGSLDISFNIPGEKSYHTILSYDIPAPTTAQLDKLVRKAPFYSREIRNLPGYSDNIRTIGFNGQEMLSAVKAGKLKHLPVIYINKEYPFKVVDVPMDKTLRVGQEYVFILSVPENEGMMINNNSSKYQLEWEKDGTRVKTVFIPEHPGRLLVGMKEPGAANYSVLLEYEVK